MLQITLWQLNESYPALLRLASQNLPKDQIKLAWKIKRVVSSAKREMEDLTDSMTRLMTQCGVVQNSADNDIEKLNDFNFRSRYFMKSTHVDVWGDPIRLSDIAEFISLSPLDLANLDWLIIEDEEKAEPNWQALSDVVSITSDGVENQN